MNSPILYIFFFQQIFASCQKDNTFLFSDTPITKARRNTVQNVISLRSSSFMDKIDSSNSLCSEKRRSSGLAVSTNASDPISHKLSITSSIERPSTEQSIMRNIGSNQIKSIYNPKQFSSELIFNRDKQDIKQSSPVYSKCLQYVQSQNEKSVSGQLCPNLYSKNTFVITALIVSLGQCPL